MRATVMASDLCTDRIHLYLIEGCSGKLFLLILQNQICWQVCSLPGEESITAGENEITMPRKGKKSRNVPQRAPPGGVEFPDPVFSIVMS